MPTMKKSATEAADEAAEKLVARDKQRISARAGRQEPADEDERDDDEPRAEPGEGTVIELDEDDDDDEDEDERPSRRERRRQRGNTLLAQERDRADRLERELAELRGGFQAMQQQLNRPQNQQEESEEDKALKQTSKDTAALLVRIEAAKGKQGGMTQQEAEAFDLEYREIQQRQTDAMYLKAQKKFGGNRQMSADEVMAIQLSQEFPGVFANRNAMQYADGEWKRMLAKGAPNNAATVKKAFQEAAKEFRTGDGSPVQREVSAATRTRFSSVSRGSGGDADSSPRQVRLSAKQMAMAEERYPNLKPAEAHKTWAKKILLREKRARA